MFLAVTNQVFADDRRAAEAYTDIGICLCICVYVAYKYMYTYRCVLSEVKAKAICE